MKYCINCGNKLDLNVEAKEAWVEQMFCRDCAGKFAEEVITDLVRKEKGGLVGPHQKNMPPEIDEQMTSWNPKTKTGTKSQKKNSKGDKQN